MLKVQCMATKPRTKYAQALFALTITLFITRHRSNGGTSALMMMGKTHRTMLVVYVDLGKRDLVSKNHAVSLQELRPKIWWQIMSMLLICHHISMGNLTLRQEATTNMITKAGYTGMMLKSNIQIGGSRFHISSQVIVSSILLMGALTSTENFRLVIHTLDYQRKHLSRSNSILCAHIVVQSVAIETTGVFAISKMQTVTGISILNLV